MKACISLMVFLHLKVLTTVQTKECAFVRLYTFGLPCYGFTLLLLQKDQQTLHDEPT